MSDSIEPEDTKTARAQTRPNILFIITDQHRSDHVGCAGNEVVHMA